jgi:hypothetical protein
MDSLFRFAAVILDDGQIGDDDDEYDDDDDDNDNDDNDDDEIRPKLYQIF